MKVNILTDNNHSFLINSLKHIKKLIMDEGHQCKIFYSHSKISKGDILLLLGCDKILSSRNLTLHKKNFVIHPSKLPKGKGGASLIWEILKGKKVFYLTMFNANTKVDAGNIVFVRKFKLKGYELHDEIRHIQKIETIKLIKKFLKNLNNIKEKKQSGTDSYNRKRNPLDSEIDINKSINDQFNLLRVCDNKNYPAFFIKNKKKYILKIYKSNE